MELPRDQRKRHDLYLDLIRTCDLASRQDRRDRHRRLRGLALTGTETLQRARFNALKEWQRLSSSLVYAPENVQFGPVYPPYYGGRDPERWTNEDMEQMVELQREDFHRLWFDSSSPDVFRQQVGQAHYADTAIVKLFVNHGQPEFDLIPDPSDFCVLEESRRIDQQEAMVHLYTAALPQFWRMLIASDLSDAERERLFRLAITHAQPRKQEDAGAILAGAFQPLLIAATSPNLQGNVNRMNDSALGLPQSTEPVAPLAELWVWDDRASARCAKCRLRREHHWHAWTAGGGHDFELGDYVGDYRVVTVFTPTDTVVAEPVNPLGIERSAFFPLQLGDDEPGYAWGISPMEPLISLQSWLNEKIGVVDWYDDMTMDPPISHYGVAGRDGEEMKGWRKPGGNIPLMQPNSKVELHRPPLNPDQFAMVNKILDFIYAMQGIPKVMRGLADAGMRSAEQPMAQAMLAAGPTLSMAMKVERTLQAAATAMAHLWRNICDRPLVRANGERFLLSQMPDDFTMRVFSHSSSPVYTEDIRNRALAAHKQGLLTPHAALRFQNFPGTDMLLRESAKIEEAQAKRAEEAINLKKIEVEAKKLKALK